MATPITLTTDGLLLNWLKNVGDSVKAGDIIAEVEADKATVEIEAPADGVLIEQKADIGEELTEGAVLGVIGAADEAAAPATQPKQEAAQDESPKSVDVERPASQPVPSTTTPEGRIKASPLARRIAEEKGVDLQYVPGSGPGGRIVKSDVEAFDPSKMPSVSSAGATPAPTGTLERATYGKLPEGDDVEIIEISRMRRAIADGTILSKQQVPHFYLTIAIDVEPLVALRKQINAQLENEGVKVSVNDMIVKAAALALRKFPNLNSHYYGDKIVRHKSINIGIAVALPNNGLVNVVAHNADKIALSELAKTNKAMFDRAREGKIKPDDIKGATFTISNLGPYNIDHFAAIISTPEAGILAVGAAKQVPIVKDDGTLGVGTRMNVTLSVDHRVSDGAEGAQYLNELKALLENPMRLLV
ncbi:MAG: dihydrolipoamide acetyltransferase [Phototrophicales bacterium]|nr:MAG: dihydrolipoamide acetyltransferase [Phototrophicales bacterium]